MNGRLIDATTPKDAKAGITDKNLEPGSVFNRVNLYCNAKALMFLLVKIIPFGKLVVPLEWMIIARSFLALMLGVDTL